MSIFECCVKNCEKSVKFIKKCDCGKLFCNGHLKKCDFDCPEKKRKCEDCFKLKLTTKCCKKKCCSDCFYNENISKCAKCNFYFCKNHKKIKSCKSCHMNCCDECLKTENEVFKKCEHCQCYCCVHKDEDEKCLFECIHCKKKCCKDEKCSLNCGACEMRVCKNCRYKTHLVKCSINGCDEYVCKKAKQFECKGCEAFFCERHITHCKGCYPNIFDLDLDYSVFYCLDCIKDTKVQLSKCLSCKMINCKSCVVYHECEE